MSNIVMKKQHSNLWIGVLLLAIMVSCSSSPKKIESKINPAIDNILSRKSVRNYQDRGIEKEKIDLLLRAGMAAPSGRDIRPWEFVVVTERAKLDTMAASLPYAKMLAQTRYAIVVCGDSIKSFYWYLDCAAAAQNILLAAESLELGAVWTAAYPYEDRMQAVSKTVGLPKHVLPLCVIPVGYPATKQNPKDKFDEMKIHYEKY